MPDELIVLIYFVDYASAPLLRYLKARQGEGTHKLRDLLWNVGR